MKTVKKVSSAFTVCFLLVTGEACGDGKLHRSDTKQWSVREFRKLGAKIDLPRAATVLIESESALVVAMHSIPPPRGVFDDTVFLLTIDVSRVTSPDIEKRLKFLLEPPNATNESDLEVWMAKQHPKVDFVDRREYSYYRYDVPCNGSDVLQTKAELRNIIQGGAAIFKTEDDVTVRRILNSARCVQRR